jgi:hypothetical protein
MLLNDTKEVEQEGCAKFWMWWFWSEKTHGHDGETRRKTRQRNSESESETETVFWSWLCKTITSSILIRFGWFKNPWIAPSSPGWSGETMKPSKNGMLGRYSSSPWVRGRSAEVRVDGGQLGRWRWAACARRGNQRRRGSLLVDQAAAMARGRGEREDGRKQPELRGWSGARVPQGKAQQIFFFFFFFWTRWGAGGAKFLFNS